jgi:hypothetical protein
LLVSGSVIVSVQDAPSQELRSGFALSLASARSYWNGRPNASVACRLCKFSVMPGSGLMVIVIKLWVELLLLPPDTILSLP